MTGTLKRRSGRSLARDPCSGCTSSPAVVRGCRLSQARNVCGAPSPLCRSWGRLGRRWVRVGVVVRRGRGRGSRGRLGNATRAGRYELSASRVFKGEFSGARVACPLHAKRACKHPEDRKHTSLRRNRGAEACVGCPSTFQVPSASGQINCRIHSGVGARLCPTNASGKRRWRTTE